MPRGRATSKENHSGNQKNRYSAQQSSKPDQNAVTRDEDIRTIQRLKEQIASKQVEEQMEKQAKIEYDKEFFEMDPESIHQLVPVNFIRHLDYSQNDVALYNRTMQDMFSVSRRMQRSIKDALRDLEEGDADRFLHFGRLIDTRAAYRLDGRCFMNRFVPSDMPEMAISILVDMSWSMSRDGRDIHSRKAAMMLYDFGQGLHIPVNVAGHTTTGIGVDYHIFSDFDNISGNDKFRMAQIKHGESVFCCNRDGLAIDITANHLAKRPEEIKLLFIICDGRPNHRGYSGEVACEDIQNIVKKYRKKGIEMIACAIGDDKDLIREIYQEAYLDITDLQTMPKTLVNLVKRKLMTFGY